MQCSAADTHLELLDHVVSGVSFSTGGVFDCDLAHRRDVKIFYSSIIAKMYKNQ